MFRRAVISDEISQDFERAAGIARQFGLNGVELRSVWDKNPHELDAADVSALQKIAAAAGLAIPCIAAPVFKCNLDDEEAYREHLAILEQTIKLAQALGATLIRGFTFWDNGAFERDLPLIAARIAAIAPTLQANRLTLVLESDPATYANSSQRLEKVLRLVASERIKALWDPGNNLYVSGAERPFPEGYERLAPFLAHIHVKDVFRDPLTGHPEACPLGHGEVGVGAVFKRLRAAGYQGWLSLETHYRKRGTLSDDMLALPKGSAFSLGGEEATCESLRLWNELLRTEGLAP